MAQKIKLGFVIQRLPVQNSNKTNNQPNKCHNQNNQKTAQIKCHTKNPNASIKNTNNKTNWCEVQLPQIIKQLKTMEDKASTKTK